MASADQKGWSVLGSSKTTASTRTRRAKRGTVEQEPSTKGVTETQQPSVSTTDNNNIENESLTKTQPIVNTDGIVKSQATTQSNSSSNSSDSNKDTNTKQVPENPTNNEVSNVWKTKSKTAILTRNDNDNNDDNNKRSKLPKETTTKPKQNNSTSNDNNKFFKASKIQSQQLRSKNTNKDDEILHTNNHVETKNSISQSPLPLQQQLSDTSTDSPSARTRQDSRQRYLPPHMRDATVNQTNPKTQPKLTQPTQQQDDVPTPSINENENHISSKPQSITPRPQNITPRSQNISPRPQNISPRPQNISPRPQNISPRPQNITPRRMDNDNSHHHQKQKNEFKDVKLNMEDSKLKKNRNNPKPQKPETQILKNDETKPSNTTTETSTTSITPTSITATPITPTSTTTTATPALLPNKYLETKNKLLISAPLVKDSTKVSDKSDLIKKFKERISNRYENVKPISSNNGQDNNDDHRNLADNTLGAEYQVNHTFYSQDHYAQDEMSHYGHNYNYSNNQTNANKEFDYTKENEQNERNLNENSGSFQNYVAQPQQSYYYQYQNDNQISYQNYNDNNDINQQASYHTIDDTQEGYNNHLVQHGTTPTDEFAFMHPTHLPNDMRDVQYSQSQNQQTVNTEQQTFDYDASNSQYPKNYSSYY